MFRDVVMCVEKKFPSMPLELWIAVWNGREKSCVWCEDELQ